MQKKSILITVIGFFTYWIFASSSFGPAADYAGNLTGSTGGTATCNSSSSCHGGSASSTTSVSLTLCDSGTTTTRTTYVPNTWYTVRLSGSNSLSRSRFGFQASSVNSSGAQKGRFKAVASYTDTIFNSSTSPIQIIEHYSPIAGSSGTYSTYFNWKSPASGTGTINFYSILNAVNYNGNADTGDKWNSGSVLSISEATATGIEEFGSNYVFAVYPNPVISNASLEIQNAVNGTYCINIFDYSGRKVFSKATDVNTSDFRFNIDAASWQPGVYFVVVEKNAARHMLEVIKQ